ncbi:MAG: hypothetical protein OXK76_05790 [Gammaproteobacteria bacterium]|nr:hypothetical protein [Gammaproteobacteria bacterium]
MASIVGRGSFPQTAFNGVCGINATRGFPWRAASRLRGLICVALVLATGMAWACRIAAVDAHSQVQGRTFLFPSASASQREGFVRVVNRSARAGEVEIRAVDDSGRSFDPVTLEIDAGETVHFNSGDLEAGNPDKGLSAGTGPGEGDWRVDFTSDLKIDVLSYLRTQDGFLTGINAIAPMDEHGCRVATFNPGSNLNRVSVLRLVNLGSEEAAVTIRGTDDAGSPGQDAIGLAIDAGAATEVTAQELESGTGLDGRFGNGTGKWRLVVETEQPVVAMSLLDTPSGHLTNLSAVPAPPADGVHRVPLLPAAGDVSGRQGLVRVVNRSPDAGEVRIKAYDETDRDFEAVTLPLGANAAVQFNSDHLERGRRGLSAGTGPGEGSWRLEMTSDLDIEVLAYVRTADGFLTSMHDAAPSTGNRHRVAVFNPGSNPDQVSRLRLVNLGETEAAVTIRGVDDLGESPGSAVEVLVPAGAVRELWAAELETGAGLDAALGDGTGKWRLVVESEEELLAMSLLESPTGHLANLSATVPRWDPVPTEDHFVETALGNPDGVRTAVVDGEGFQPGTHGQRITDIFLDNTDHGSLTQIDGWGEYLHHGDLIGGVNPRGYIKFADGGADGIFWSATDDSPWYEPGSDGWFLADGRPFNMTARTFARWARYENVLLVASMENSSSVPNEEGGFDPEYCDDYDISSGYWTALCDTQVDYIVHTGTGVDKLLLAGTIDEMGVAGGAIWDDGVFAPHAIYVESPDGSTSQATPVLAAYATNLWSANPQWGAARLKRELMDLAREETLDYANGGATSDGTVILEQRTIKVIRPEFAPSPTP